MAYCPTCKQTYPDEVTECPDDGSKLVDELPYQTVQAEGDAWVEIASTGTEDEAQLLRGFLVESGIPAQIENVKFNMEPINFGAMGDIRIYVGADDEARALELLKKREAEFEKLDDDTETVVTDEGPATIEEDATAEREAE